MNTCRVTLDVSKAPSITRTVRVGERDRDGTTLIVDVTDHGTPLSIENFDVSLLIKFDDENLYEIVGSASGNQATFTINAEYMQRGRTDRACVQISGDDFILSTARFILEVLESAEV